MEDSLVVTLSRSQSIPHAVPYQVAIISSISARPTAILVCRVPFNWIGAFSIDALFQNLIHRSTAESFLTSQQLLAARSR